MRPGIVLLILVVMLAITTHAAETDIGPVADSGGELDFIGGTWVGGDENTLIEEIWTHSSNGLMLGMFRMISGGEPRFYELMSLERTDSGWEMFLRHFSPGLQAWEEKDGALIFDLKEVTENRALFDQRDAETNLIYERDGDELTVTLEKFVDGEWKRTPFQYRLAE